MSRKYLNISLTSSSRAEPPDENQINKKLLHRCDSLTSMIRYCSQIRKIAPGGLFKQGVGVQKRSKSKVIITAWNSPLSKSIVHNKMNLWTNFRYWFPTWHFKVLTLLKYSVTRTLWLANNEGTDASGQGLCKLKSSVPFPLTTTTTMSALWNDWKHFSHVSLA